MRGEGRMEVEMREPDMSLEDAGMLLSAMGNLQFRQVVDPKGLTL